MKAQIVSANEWLYPDSKANDVNRICYRIPVAKGSFACFQLLISDCSKGMIELKRKAIQENVIDWQVHRLLPVYVEQNTGRTGFTAKPGESAKEYTTRQAPFWVYDAMAPLKDEPEFKDSDENVGLYFCGGINEEFASGVYQEEFEVSIQGESCVFCVEVCVCDAVIPQKENLQIIQWFSLKNMAAYHNIELWSEEHWDMMRRYGMLMRHARQTHFWINKELYDITRLDNGDYSFDFSKAKRFIQMYLDLGFRFIESGMAIEREKYEDSSFIIKINDGFVKALSEEGERYLHSYFSALRKFLSENHWLDITIQHIADEPHKDCVDEYRILAGIVRKEMPGVKLFDAVETTELYGALDIYCPQNHFYEDNRDVFERLREQGNSLWYYTCCKPGGHYLNRTLDFPVLRTRYLHWGNFLYNIEGFLHWGFNYFDWTDDPYKGRAGSSENLGEVQLPPGDTHIVYPGKKKPYKSVRLEAMRAGGEDYELFMQLKQKKPEQANKLLHTCVRSFSDFSEDLTVFEKTYERLLEEVSCIEK